MNQPSNAQTVRIGTGQQRRVPQGATSRSEIIPMLPVPPPLGRVPHDSFIPRPIEETVRLQFQVAKLENGTKDVLGTGAV